jgi:hypothetical protein
MTTDVNTMVRRKHLKEISRQKFFPEYRVPNRSRQKALFKGVEAGSLQDV